MHVVDMTRAMPERAKALGALEDAHARLEQRQKVQTREREELRRERDAATARATDAESAVATSERRASRESS